MSEESMLDKVRNSSSTKQIELLKVIAQQNDDLLGELISLNDKKAKQLDNDKIFREAWEQLKKNDRYTAYIMVILGLLAFSLDIVQLEDFYIIKERFFSLIQPITTMTGG